MVRSEFINVLAERQPHLLPHDIELAVNSILEQMALSLEAGERIEIRGFGSFSLHQRPPHHARNPKTGEAVHLPAKVFIHFKSGKDMRDRVNGRKVA